MSPLLPDRRAVLELVRAFDASGDGEAEKSRELMVALLEWSPEPLSRRSYVPGHITCTGCVLSPDRRKLLLVHHRRLDRWLLPGGHVECGDSGVADTARREVIEETGACLTPLPPRLAGIDVHAIPPRGGQPLHLHHDMIFAFAAEQEAATCSQESRAVIWCGLHEFDRYALPGSIRRAVARALRPGMG